MTHMTHASRVVRHLRNGGLTADGAVSTPAAAMKIGWLALLLAATVAARAHEPVGAAAADGVRVGGHGARLLRR
jgi:hypothetical protein